MVSKTAALGFRRESFELVRVLERPLGFSPEEQMGPGKLVTPQEGRLRGTGSGCPPVL